MTLANLVPPTPANGAGVAGTFLVPLLLRLWGYAPGVLLVIGIIGGLMGIVWYSIMIGESNTFKQWRAKRSAARDEKSARRKLMRINLLKAEERAIMAELAQLDPTPMVKMAEAAGSAPTIPRGSDLRIAEHANTETAPPSAWEPKREKGEKGDSGERGEKGDSGERGEKGDKGEKGNKGESHE